jgi:hypothetical protein
MTVASMSMIEPAIAGLRKRLGLVRLNRPSASARGARLGVGFGAHANITRVG